MTKDVESYLAEGCGRCALGGTPECKVHLWTKELLELRRIALSCGLSEEAKWGVPCYMHKKKNIMLLAAFKGYCSLSFFNGYLLSNDSGLLQRQSENSVQGRLLKFTSVTEILANEDVIRSIIFEAIDLENTGVKPMPSPKANIAIPAELSQVFATDPALQQAFEALSPSKQKGYVLHITQAKQEQTRFARIEKCKERIFIGKGLNEY